MATTQQKPSPSSISELESLGELTLDLPSPRISEVVIRTSHYDAMKMWYQAALSVKPFFEYAPDPSQHKPQPEDKLENYARLCFLRVHQDYPYSQVIALFDVAELLPSATASGLHHIQLRQASLPTLFERFDRLQAMGILPYRTFNHGPATSFYYEDLDGNLVEMSAANFEREQDFLNYFQTPAFKKNPAGIAIDAADFLRRYRAGEALGSITRIPE